MSNSPVPNLAANETAAPYGNSFVGKSGIISMAVFLILLPGLMLYLLVKVWPRCSPSGTAPQSQSQSAIGSNGTGAPGLSASSGTTDTGCQDIEPAQIPLFWGFWKPWISGEIRLLLIVILAGVFGSLVHALRSFWWYVGNRGMKWSWCFMYILLPFTGGILAMIFYFVVRGGFFSPQSTIKQTSPFAFAAFAGLVGMFSSQAVAKLKQIAATLLTPDQQGKDHISLAPTIVSISPMSGPAAGSTPITIAGTNFISGAKLTIGGTEAAISSIHPTSIAATTPPHAVGKADVEIVNPDSQKCMLSGGFTYV